MSSWPASRLPTERAVAVGRREPITKPRGPAERELALRERLMVSAQYTKPDQQMPKWISLFVDLSPDHEVNRRL